MSEVEGEDWKRTQELDQCFDRSDITLCANRDKVKFCQRQ